MKNPTVRIIVVVLALAALGGAGYQAWRVDEQIRSGRQAGVAFENQVRQAAQTLAAIGAAQRAYVAEGQVTERWETQLTGLVKSAGPMLTDLRAAAKTPEGQAALESAIETMTQFGQADARARNYAGSGQRLSASDVIFADGSELLTKADAAIEDARGKEGARRDATAAALRQQQLTYLGGAVGFTVVILFVLIPAPKADGSAADDAARPSGTSSGLGLSGPGGSGKRGADAGRPAGEARTRDVPDAGAAFRVHDLGTTADVCAAMARVRDPQELPALLERAAKSLDASGVIVWMSEGATGVLRPVLAHGYTPAALARMGTIGPDEDNATANAYRSRTLQTLPAEPHAGGAIVAPLVTADGCTGVIAVELNKRIEPTDYLRSVATILAAQLATLITPAPAADSMFPGR